MEEQGARLKRLREAAGLTQAKLAAAAGVSQGTIGNVESGLRGYGRSLVPIARALGVSPEYLTGEAAAPTQRQDAPSPPAGPGRTPTPAQWQLLDDFEKLPDDEKEALRENLRAKAQHIQRLVDEQLARLGISSSPVPDSKVEAAFGAAPPPPPARPSDYRKATPIPPAPVAPKKKVR